MRIEDRGQCITLMQKGITFMSHTIGGDNQNYTPYPVKMALALQNSSRIHPPEGGAQQAQ